MDIRMPFDHNLYHEKRFGLDKSDSEPQQFSYQDCLMVNAEEKETKENAILPKSALKTALWRGVS